MLPGRWRALRLLWVLVVYVTCESVLLVVLLGLWLASGFGRRIRTPYFEGIHYDLVQGLMWVVFREARRVLRAADRDRRARRRTPTRARRCWSPAGTPARATRSR